MKAAYHVGRIVFGLWFLFSGAEYFFPSLGLQPLGNQALSREFSLTLIHSGLFAWIKVAEVLIGLACLADRTMPVTALACLPLTVVIGWWNFVLEGGLVPWIFGIATAVINLIMLWPYRRLYLPFLVWDAPREY
jgi:uncharacterized membrane protein YphA (DoxX/SURF4 family)